MPSFCLAVAGSESTWIVFAQSRLRLDPAVAGWRHGRQIPKHWQTLKQVQGDRVGSG